MGFGVWGIVFGVPGAVLECAGPWDSQRGLRVAAQTKHGLGLRFRV